MRLTTKGRFAVTAMVDLAMSGGERPVTLADISQRQKISLSYLEQLFGKLRRRTLVSSVRGPGGGYRLTRPTAEVSVGDIILAVDEPIDATQCGGKENCRDDHKCITHDLWTDLNRHIFDYLSSVSLFDLVEKQQQKSASSSVVEFVERREEAAPVVSETV
ncbi:MAG: Fe-S cluster assembly transcriptional regulator IscR [Betaproteobacteria bacterium]|nr:MAG: Fe-S cluster assembly transcriptional regulator IscR [Betaproteobacteria bacterium]